MTAILFWFGSHHDARHCVDAKITWREQLAALKDPNVWKYCQYYSIVFGGYVALSLWMMQYYVGEYGLDIRVAALLAACFSLPGGVLRAVGGWFSDRYGAHRVTWWVLWVSWICLFILSYPQTDMTIQTVNGPTDLPRRPERLDVHRADVRGGRGVGVRQGIGVQVHRRRVPAQHRRHLRHRRASPAASAASCCRSCSASLQDLTGIRSTAFMLLYGVVWVSLIWMYWTEVRQAEVMGPRAKAFSLKG